MRTSQTGVGDTWGFIAEPIGEKKEKGRSSLVWAYAVASGGLKGTRSRTGVCKVQTEYDHNEGTKTRETLNVTENRKNWRENDPATK